MPRCATIGSKKNLETEGHSATYRSGGLNEVDGVSIASHHRDIALCQKIPEVHENFHVSREKTGWDGLPEAEVQIRVGPARRTVEFIDRSQGMIAGVAVGGDPTSFSLGQSATELRGN